MSTSHEDCGCGHPAHEGQCPEWWRYPEVLDARQCGCTGMWHRPPERVSREERARMNVTLTGEERRVLLAHLEEQWADPAIPVTITRAVAPAVERIVAARLAAVEALADDWEAATGYFSPRLSASALRAALARVPVGGDAVST